MKVQVIQPFATNQVTRYNVGDQIEVDEKTGAALIKSGRAVEGTILDHFPQTALPILPTEKVEKADTTKRSNNRRERR